MRARVRRKIVDRAYWLAIGRGADSGRAKLSLSFLANQPLREFALATFNLNAFLYAP